MRRPLPLAYDHHPDRFRTGRAVVHELGLAGPLLHVGVGEVGEKREMEVLARVGERSHLQVSE